jgi:UDP-N-acetyl-D-mannosaminuronate dehydrogenase
MIMLPLSSTKATEMTKPLEKIHLSVTIGLVNEMKIRVSIYFQMHTACA